MSRKRLWLPNRLMEIVLTEIPSGGSSDELDLFL